jgi:hypothetical protein
MIECNVVPSVSHPGYLYRTPDTNFSNFHPRYWIQSQKDPGYRIRICIKEFKYFYLFLSFRKNALGCSKIVHPHIRILIFFHHGSGSRIHGSKKHRIRITGYF